MRHRVCLDKAHRMVYMMTFKGQFENLTSGQGQVMTRVGHVVYQATRLDETNTLVPILHLYLYYVASY